MTIEEMFYYFDEKYGDEFNWGIISYGASHFVEELKKEVGDNEPMFQKDICAVALSYWKDNLLMRICNNIYTIPFFNNEYKQ